MSKRICPVCGSEDTHEYSKHGVSHLRCNRCRYDSGDGWRDHAHRDDDDEREPEHKPWRRERQR